MLWDEEREGVADGPQVLEPTYTRALVLDIDGTRVAFLTIDASAAPVLSRPLYSRSRAPASGAAADM